MTEKSAVGLRAVAPKGAVTSLCAAVGMLVVSLLLAGCGSVRPTVTLAPDVPLTPGMCGGWPTAPALAFAGWTTFAELGFPELAPPDGAERVFAIVTRDAIDQPRLGGPGVAHGRGICILRGDGSMAVSTVPDDWLIGRPASTG